MLPKIDTHQHLLYPEKFGYSWTRDFPALQGKFHLEDYQQAARDCGIEGSLFMEADVDPKQHIEEAHFFRGMSETAGNGILGIIAKLLPEEDGFEAQLDELSSPALKAIRRGLHTEDDSVSQSAQFRENVVHLGRCDLNFDICVQQSQLPIAQQLAQACPDTYFILDHCGCPGIAGHESTSSEGFQHWQRGIQELSQASNTACKLSGIIAYTNESQRNAESLRPYFEVVLDAFGSERLVWGSDWPVCNLADVLRSWCKVTDQLLSPLSSSEQASILSENAKRIYRLG